VLLALTALQSAGFYAAVIFGLIFWYILLIKEFYIIDRKAAYEILVLVLTYLLFRVFYLRAGGGFGSGAIFFALIVAAVVGAFFSSFVKNFGGEKEKEDVSPVPAAHGRLLRQVTASTVFLVVFELLIAGLFLPLDFVYQSSIVFILAALFMEFSSKHLFFGKLSRRRVLVVSSVVFVLLVIILSSARWGL
jgi:hypothetical protein